MKKADLEELPVLDTRQFSPDQMQAMSDLFDQLAEADFGADCQAWQLVSLAGSSMMVSPRFYPSPT